MFSTTSVWSSTTAKVCAVQFRQSGSVEDRQFQVGIGGAIERPPDPFGLDFIGGFTQARRIRKHDRETAKVEMDFHHIPGRPRPLRNYRGFTACQHIQQAGLAGIGRTEDRYVDAVAQPFTPPVVVQMSCDLTGQRLKLRAHHTGDALGKVFVREVDVGFKVCQSPRQPVTPAIVEPAKLAFHLAQRLPPLSRRVGVHQIGDGFGGGKVEFPVLETPSAELARLGDPQTGQARQRVDHSGDDRPSAMDMKLRNVLAGKAMGAGKPQHQSLVEKFPAIGNGQPDERGHAGSGQGTAGQRRESRPGERS